MEFLHRSPYGAVVGVCGWNSADNTPGFRLSLNPAGTASRLPLFSTLPVPPRVGWGWAGDGEGTQPGQWTQTGQRDVPHCVTSCSAIKNSRGRRRMARELSSKPTIAQRLAGHHSASGRWQVIPFPKLVFLFFTSPINLVSISVHEFSHLCSSC